MPKRTSKPRNKFNIGNEVINPTILCECNSEDTYKNCCHKDKYSKEEIQIIKDIRNKLSIIGDNAYKLYNNALNDHCEHLLKPTDWLYNETAMRESWNKFKLECNKSGELIRTSMLNNSFSKYMDYMCENYPIGYGKITKEKLTNKQVLDGAKIYYELTK